MPSPKKQSAIEAFLALPDQEKERQCREFDKEFIIDQSRPLTPKERRWWNRVQKELNRGRPRVGRGAKVVSLSMERTLLARTDKLAKQMGLSRSALVARLVEKEWAARRAG